MRDVIVAVDLETTGLDPARDRIIEIGAVKFQGSEILDEWQTLVNPGCPIPAFITRLTGITTQAVEDAPPVASVLPDLRRFIGSAPLLAHNVRFDQSFLWAEGLRIDNPVIDSYVLSSVLMPDVPRYSLTSLASLLGVGASDAHRAINDAHMTVALYLSLWERALALPLNTLAEIVRLGKQMPWDGALVFEAALKERSREVFTAPSPRDSDSSEDNLGALFEATSERNPPLQPRPSLQLLDVDELEGLVGPEGPLAAAFDGYEHRPQQTAMLRQVSQALNQGRHVLIEAPTGVGKSLAYLLPAVVFAVQNNDRVVVSTNTINLQEQLIQKDLPLLSRALDTPFRAAVLKGRANYLCPRRLAALRRRGPTTPEEMHVLGKVLVWLTANQSGDRGEITLRGPAEMGIWRRLSAEDEGCTMERCQAQMGGACPLYRARRCAEAAHLLIVNHALLLSDVVADGHVLPDYRYLIVDEAHHLESAITNSMTFRIEPDAIRRQLADLGTAKTGLLGDLLRQTQGVIPDGYHATLRDYADTVAGAGSAMGQHADWFFEKLRGFLEDHVRVPRNEYTQQIRILDVHRRQPGWSEVEVRWDNLSQFTGGIAEAMVKLAQGLSELADYDIEDFDDLLAAISSAARHLTALHERLAEIVSAPDANTIYWVELQPDGGRISIHTAPLDVGPLVQRHLWYQKDTIVMTSATLRTDGTFDFLREQLDAEDVDEVVVDTPFDYEASTLLYVVNDIAEPSDYQAFQRDVQQGVLDLARATGGRMMVLFTSYAQLRETASAISDELALAGITVYDQSDGSSRTQLLDGFVQSERAVLMGTRSFWEGVDVPGADLSVLVIVRLPFSVPSDPLFAARSEQFENPFQQYALPETILRFRQGFGRLIRRKTDRGVVAIFDRRVISKQYGRMFLNALPPCTVRHGRLGDLPAATLTWLGED